MNSTRLEFYERSHTFLANYAKILLQQSSELNKLDLGDPLFSQILIIYLAIDFLFEEKKNS